MTRCTSSPNQSPAGIDLALVAQRILKLAELSVLEHLEALDRSQGAGLSEMFRGSESEDAAQNAAPAR